MNTKTCTKCGVEKELSEFHKSKDGKIGFTSWCKECCKKIHKDYRDNNKEKRKKWQKKYYKEHKIDIYTYNQINKEKRRIYDKNYGKARIEFKRNQSLLRTYNIDSKKYNELFNEQNGVCKICGKSEVVFDKRINRHRFLAVDHNHQSGKVRGLLCSKCNRGLGLFNEDINVLNKVIIYLSNQGK